MLLICIYILKKKPNNERFTTYEEEKENGIYMRRQKKICYVIKKYSYIYIEEELQPKKYQRQIVPAPQIDTRCVHSNTNNVYIYIY